MYDGSRRRELAVALAAAFLAGPWTEDALVRRGASILQPRPHWLRRLAREVVAGYHRPPANRPRELAAYVEVRARPLGAHARRVCGSVVNERLNVPRPEYDRLKAILHDAALHGPQAANRAGVPDFRSHIAGRIAWVASLHPEGGRRLGERFAAIEW